MGKYPFMAIGVAVLALTSAAAAQTIAVRPGRYAITSELGFADSRSGLREVKSFDCLTPDEARDLVNAFTKEVGAAGSCRISNATHKGNTLTIETTCREDGPTSAGTMQMTYGADWFKAAISMTLDGRRSITRTNAKWVAPDCKDED